MTIVKYVIMLTIVATSLICVAISIPLLFSDSGPVKEYLLYKVGDAVGGDVEAEYLELSLFSSPQIVLKKLMIQDREEGRILLQLHDGYCDLQLFPLVIGQVVINQCTLDQPIVTVRRQQNGRWSWLIFSDSEHDSGTSLVTFAGLKDLGIHNGRVILIDESTSEPARSLGASRFD